MKASPYAEKRKPVGPGSSQRSVGQPHPSYLFTLDRIFSHSGALVSQK
jgi:hypothetical protein